ncbi:MULTISPECIES: pilus assembly PilX family protein [Polaromonas]|uniref:PilX N-terminal domain-containing pilus assembly protein n=1 Tax=Polaromonas aquatica TaxID=332657 RepID=A0ABW1U2V7_9BURK
MSTTLSRGERALRARRHQKESGIVLILALILLVVISTVAVLAVRNSISGEQVSNNLRVSAVATQAAETALRYCENQVLSRVSTLVINTMPLNSTQTVPNLWASRTNWTTGVANTVTAAISNSSNAAGRTVTTLPGCMIEKYPLVTLQGGPARESYLITARGYSQDYSTNSSGQVKSGSEVWLQSILRQ